MTLPPAGASQFDLLTSNVVPRNHSTSASRVDQMSAVQEQAEYFARSVIDARGGSNGITRRGAKGVLVAPVTTSRSAHNVSAKSCIGGAVCDVDGVAR